MRRRPLSLLPSFLLAALVASTVVAGGAAAQTAAAPAATTTPAAKPGRGIYAERGPDGSITREAWMTAAAARAAARFDALDANHDGVLSKAELAAGHKTRAKTTPTKPAQ
ncbi:MAG TPA: hypothetical protein VNT30_19120 [Stellaceae bacterium]|nr:hypothetical protein [Stellaceae bacterium]